MGGPVSEYYNGWFSELQNEPYELEEETVKTLLKSYDRQLIGLINRDTLVKIKNILDTPFRYTPTEYILENKCVMPGLWLLVPDNWIRKSHKTSYTMCLRIKGQALSVAAAGSRRQRRRFRSTSSSLTEWILLPLRKAFLSSEAS